MNNKKFTYNNLIKDTNLTPLEKFINFPFYTYKKYYTDKCNFTKTGSLILLNEKQKDLTFDDIYKYIYSNFNVDPKYRDRDIEMLKDKFTNDISNSKLAEKYGLSLGRVSEIIRRLHRRFINKTYTNIEKIADMEGERFLFYIKFYIDQKEIHDDDIIDKCGFSLKVYNTLRRGRINYVKDLKELKAEELLKIRNLGKNNIREICNKCKALNIELDESVISICNPEVKPTDDDYKEKYEKLLDYNNILLKSNKRLSDRVEFLENMNGLQEKIITSFKNMYRRDFKRGNNLRPKVKEDNNMKENINIDYKEKYEKLLEENKMMQKTLKRMENRMEYLGDMYAMSKIIIENYDKMYKEDHKDEISLRPADGILYNQGDVDIDYDEEDE